MIAAALEEGYREYLMQHKFPMCFLHITIDPNLVDVNVHPSKMDVRFSDGIAFSRFLSTAVHDTLSKREMIPDIDQKSDKERRDALKKLGLKQEKEHTPEPFEKNRTGEYRLMEETKYQADSPKMQDLMQNPLWKRAKDYEITEEMAGKPAESGESMTDPESGETFFTETSELPKESDILKSSELLKPYENPKSSESSEADENPNSSELPEAAPSQLNFFDEKILTAQNRPRFRIIGQIFETYWLAEFEDRLLMIDQHAAHEKVNYERLMRQFKEKSVVSQNLLPPVIVSLSAQEETVLRENADVFKSLGFETEPFGGSEYALRSVPVDLYGCNEREMFLEVLDQLAEGVSFGGIRVIEEKIASMSCKAAVKGNSLLSLPEAEALIDELLTLDNPYNCPHGRPTIISMTKYELEKKFRRIV